MQARLVFLITGALFIVLGTFSPIVSAPIIGSISLFTKDKVVGLLLIVLAIIAIAFGLLRSFKQLWSVGGAAGGVVLYVFFATYLSLLGTQEAAKISLAGNPFGGLGQLFANAIQVSWGGPLLVVGVLFILIAAGYRDNQDEEVTKNPKGIYLPIIFGLILFLGAGAAGLVSGQNQRTDIVRKAKEEAEKAAEQARQAEVQRQEQEVQRQQEEAARVTAEAAEQQARQDALTKLKVKFDWQSNDYSRYLVGTVVNESDRVVHGVAVKFSLLDENKNLVGDTSDIVDTLNPGQTWAFKALVFEDGARYAQLGEVTGRAYEY